MEDFEKALKKSVLEIKARKVRKKKRINYFCGN